MVSHLSAPFAQKHVRPFSHSKPIVETPAAIHGVNDVGAPFVTKNPLTNTKGIPGLATSVAFANVITNQIARYVHISATTTTAVTFATHTLASRKT